MELDKHSLNIGDYNRAVGKGPGSRPQISKESSMERSPYFDKVSCLFYSRDLINKYMLTSYQFLVNILEHVIISLLIRC